MPADMYLCVVPEEGREKAPTTWVGEVSWGKGMMLDYKRFVPAPIDRISELLGDEPLVIDDALITAVAEAMTLENQTDYRLATSEAVTTFLKTHKGKQITAENQ